MYRPTPDELDDVHVASCSDEPMPRPDHKAKRHGRPYAGSRAGEKIGGGHFVMKRGRRTGRIKTGYILAGAMPFEHPDFDSAMAEAVRLRTKHGGTYGVFAEVARIEDIGGEIGE